MARSRARRPTSEARSGSTGWLIAGKLAPPRHAPGVLRSALLDRLDAGLERRLSLIVASAGYGKTTLAAQWRDRLQARAVKVAWLTLDEDDGDATQFLSYVISALDGAGVELGTLPARAARGLAEIPVRSALAALVNAIAADEARLVLMLDDFHKIRASPAAGLVNNLIAHAPSGLHLLLACRETPPLAIADLKCRNELTAFDAFDLRFSAAQAAEFLAHTLTQAQTELLVERTEGWPVALQLARLWLEEDGTRVAQIDGFSGRISEIAGYLAEQIFAGLDPGLQSFLLHTCILERVNGDVANAVCERDDCWRVLDELHEFNSFLVPIGDERRWYRYHKLFAEFLQDRLLRTPAVDAGELHLRACDWFARNGHLREAVRHAHRAGRVDRAAQLIEDAGGWELIFVEGTGVVHNLIKDFTEQDLEAFPRLQLCRTYLLLKKGELRAAQEAFERVRVRTANFCSPSGRDPGRLQRDGMLVGLLLSGYQDHLATAMDTATLQRMLVAVRGDDHRALATVFMARCLHGLSIGDFRAVSYAARQTMRHLRIAGSPPAFTYPYLQLGLSQLLQGQLAEAESSYRSGLRIAEEHFGADSGPKAVADALLAEVLYQRGELAAATEHLENSLPLIEDYDGWFDIYASGYQTGIALACTRGDFEAALRLVRSGEETAISRGLSRLRVLMEAAAIRVAVASGALHKADMLVDAVTMPFSPGTWKSNRVLWRQHCALGIAFAEHAVAHNRPARAVEVLADVEACCAALGCKYQRTEVLVLRALAFQLRGRLDLAATDLSAALAAAAPQGMRQVFLDQGQPLEALCDASRQAHPEQFADESVGAFISELREAAIRRAGCAEAESSGGPITDREREVLIQLGRGYSNKTISQTLGLSENTIKFHLKNIYEKLDVDRRRRAIEVARARAIIQ